MQAKEQEKLMKQLIDVERGRACAETERNFTKVYYSYTAIRNNNAIHIGYGANIQGF